MLNMQQVFYYTTKGKRYAMSYDDYGLHVYAFRSHEFFLKKSVAA